jgi:hypothetical protein
MKRGDRSGPPPNLYEEQELRIARLERELATLERDLELTSWWDREGWLCASRPGPHGQTWLVLLRNGRSYSGGSWLETVAKAYGANVPGRPVTKET